MNALRQKLLPPLILLFGVVSITATGLRLVAYNRWWIRMCDYVALQALIVATATLCLGALLVARDRRRYRVILLLTFLCSLYQLLTLWPYFLPVAPAVPSASSAEAEESFRLLTANVQMSNRRPDSLLELVDRTSPDVVFVVETDAWWVEQLNALSLEYRHQVLRPQENFYGMALYSRIPIVSAQVHYLESETVPSIEVVLRTVKGREVVLWGLHPRPPLPGNSLRKADRELLTVARRASRESRPVVVTGDFNDVPWSLTMKTFAELSGLGDVRVGRGLYNTFHAQSSLLRTPLDHIYLSQEFRVLHLSEPLRFSSDHFALYGQFSIVD